MNIRIHTLIQLLFMVDNFETRSLDAASSSQVNLNEKEVAKNEKEKKIATKEEVKKSNQQRKNNPLNTMSAKHVATSKQQTSI